MLDHLISYEAGAPPIPPTTAPDTSLEPPQVRASVHTRVSASASANALTPVAALSRLLTSDGPDTSLLVDALELGMVVLPEVGRLTLFARATHDGAPAADLTALAEVTRAPAGGLVENRSTGDSCRVAGKWLRGRLSPIALR